MESFQHQLQRFDPGIVWLDSNNRVVALNGVARRIFGPGAGEVIGQEILQLHPEKSRNKVEWVLSSTGCPAESPPPMTMMINIPDRVLLIKVAKMWGEDGAAGTSMVFFDLTEVTTTPRKEEDEKDKPRLLFKLPVYKNNRVVLVDLTDVVHFKSEGHYTNVYTESEQFLCNLSLSDLETRLNPMQYVRVHRSHMINISFACAFEKVDDHCVIVMKTADEVRIPVSRSNMSKLKSMLGLS